MDGASAHISGVGLESRPSRPMVSPATFPEHFFYALTIFDDDRNWVNGWTVFRISLNLFCLLPM